MNMGIIIKDSLRYPFSEWKKILKFGFIIFLSVISGIYAFIGSIKSFELIYFVVFIGFLISFFVLGYGYRIIKSSLKGVNEIPKLNLWLGMYKDGIKVYIVHLVYLIPIILVIFVYKHGIFLNGFISPSEISLFLHYFNEVIIALITGRINPFIVMNGIGSFIAILYLLIVIPINYIGITNMANNDSKLRMAFEFKAISYKSAI